MHPLAKPVPVALAGMVSLAVAMGIGRFAFTPLLPMMLADGVVDLPGASWLASANYLGYLLGALLCTLQPWLWRRFPGLPTLNSPALVRLGLAATSLLTLGMALQSPGLWPLLRFAAGDGQRRGLPLHLGLVPGPVGAVRCDGARRPDVCRPRRRHRGQRPAGRRDGAAGTIPRQPAGCCSACWRPCSAPWCGRSLHTTILPPSPQRRWRNGPRRRRQVAAPKWPC